MCAARDSGFKPRRPDSFVPPSPAPKLGGGSGPGPGAGWGGGCRLTSPSCSPMALLLRLGCSLLALSTCLLPGARADCGRDCAACAYRLAPRAGIHPLVSGRRAGGAPGRCSAAETPRPGVNFGREGKGGRRRGEMTQIRGGGSGRRRLGDPRREGEAGPGALGRGRGGGGDTNPEGPPPARPPPSRCLGREREKPSENIREREIWPGWGVEGPDPRPRAPRQGRALSGQGGCRAEKRRICLKSHPKKKAGFKPGLSSSASRCAPSLHGAALGICL